jgi:hypothetical protein
MPSRAVGYKSCIGRSIDCSVLPRSAQSQDTQGERSRSNCQHKRGGSNAFDIAYAQMGHGRAHKIEDEADAPRHSHGWPPDTENQAQCAGKLTCRQKRKVLQRHAYDFVDDMHYLRIATYLPDPGKRHHRRQHNRNDQIGQIHGTPLQRAKSYGTMLYENSPFRASG